MRIGSGPSINRDWLYEVRNGRGYSAWTSQGAVVGEYSENQLMNPAGSGRTILCRNVGVTPGASVGVRVAIFNTALANLEIAGVNLNSGAADAQGQARRSTNVAQRGSMFWFGTFLANQLTIPPFDWIIALDAGEGLLVASNTVNAALTTSFTFVEY